MSYPNEIFSAFSFIGFLLSVIPLYWHLEGIFSSDALHSVRFSSCLSSLECGHHLVHGLGWPWLFESVHQFRHLEPQHGKCGPSLV